MFASLILTQSTTPGGHLPWFSLSLVPRCSPQSVALGRVRRSWRSRSTRLSRFVPPFVYFLPPPPTTQPRASQTAPTPRAPLALLRHTPSSRKPRAAQPTRQSA